jgi:aspartate carbamoyltransferase catalytic subunit
MSALSSSDQLSSEHLLGISDLSPADIELIFRTADGFKEVLNRPIKKVPSLRDITIANLFFESSTRTRVSFELAEKRLSADVVNFSFVRFEREQRGDLGGYGEQHPGHEGGHGGDAPSRSLVRRSS